MAGATTRVRALWAGPGDRSVIDHAASMVGKIWRHPENRGRRIRRVAGWIGWQVWERAVGRPRVVRFHEGVRLICRPHDQVTSMALYYGLYDSAEMRFLLAWLRRGDTFLDVGANVAPYSLLSTLVPGVRALAFEPGTEARSRALANVELNGVADRVEIVPCAVSDTEGIALLTMGPLARNSLVADDHDGPLEKVETVTLDAVVARRGLGRVTLVKLDIEGHEPAALRGAAALLDEQAPALIVECNDVAALREVAARHGYEPVAFSPDRGITRGVWPPEGGANNVILVADMAAAERRLGDPGAT